MEPLWGSVAAIFRLPALIDWIQKKRNPGIKVEWSISLTPARLAAQETWIEAPIDENGFDSITIFASVFNGTDTPVAARECRVVMNGLDETSPDVSSLGEIAQGKRGQAWVGIAPDWTEWKRRLETGMTAPRPATIVCYMGFWYGRKAGLVWIKSEKLEVSSDDLSRNASRAQPQS